MNSKQTKIQKFNPNNVGVSNGNFIGLPFDIEESNIVFFPVHWDVTVSYNDGTVTGPDNILRESLQLDIEDSDVPNAWHEGIFWHNGIEKLAEKSAFWRAKSRNIIDKMEAGESLKDSSLEELQDINAACASMVESVKIHTSKLINQGKLVGLVGGDHSTPLGYLIAIDEMMAARDDTFGILHIDAHMDLRNAYEGFTYSHASIFYNASNILSKCTNIVQVGIRDYCEEELRFAKSAKNPIEIHTMQSLRELAFNGSSFDEISDLMIKNLPQNVYISLDIDGLDPSLCPNTGTPVTEGFGFYEVVFLIKKIALSGRKIIGFDLVEVGGIDHPWDGNVGARILYKMANLAMHSWGN